MSKDVEVDYKPHVICSSENDKAHDHNKGLCIYWKISKCGFRLFLSNFWERTSPSWDITLAQLTGTASCILLVLRK
jgi:hypothetical protein